MQHNFNGRKKDNASVYDSLTFSGGEFTFCNSFDKTLFKMNDL